MAIVKMKKVSLVVLDREREEALEKLRDLGLVHIERIFAGSDKLSELNEKKALLERCSFILPPNVPGDKNKKGDLAAAEKLAGQARLWPWETSSKLSATRRRKFPKTLRALNRGVISILPMWTSLPAKGLI